MEKLGIELPLLISQIVNFTILVFVLNKLLYKPILRLLKERKKKIQEGLNFSENAKKEEEALESKREAVLKKAREEARLILEEAKKDGRSAKEEIIKDGKHETEQMKIRLTKELQAKEEQFTKEVSSHTVEIASEMLKRLLPEILDQKNQHKVITKRLKELEKIYEKEKKSGSN